MSREQLYSVALAYRGAIERYLQSHPQVNLSTNWSNPERGSFPLDCCKAASFLFGQYLLDNEMAERRDLAYVWGSRKERVGSREVEETHGWLRCFGFFVDLTPDQFEGIEVPVIVARPEESVLHASFRGYRPFPFSLREDHEFRSMSVEIGKLTGASADPAT